MSPAASRLYIVRMSDFSVYETVVLAKDKQHAIEKARALYDMNGMELVSTNGSREDRWVALCMDEEHAS